MLEYIQSPLQLHKLNLHQLNTLAEEIREKIISTVVTTGGHLGANLGVVELTLALHSVLKSPTDKIIWDVGHQSYPHKLITGRCEEFHSLRQKHGLSGFPNPQESPHDCFGVGHSSTSISAATGMAIARDLQNKDFVIAAVIGDGALTGGLAFEALNHAGQLDTDLLVILNDNAMSIANNVGALNNYLNELRLDPTLWRARTELEGFIKRIPAVGEIMSKFGLTLKDTLKSLLPGQLFEELGFSYFGPFDGHNIKQLQKAIKEGIIRGGPVIIHVITQKGKGFAPAEEEPSKYHGLSPENGLNSIEDKTAGKITSFSSVFGASMVEFAETDKNVVAITAAMRDGTGLTHFAKKYPERFFDVGIAEQHALTFAAGLATQGLRPVVALYSTFLQRGYDQVIHDICLQKLPVILAIDRGGVVGDDGPTHHGIFDLSYLRHIPNLTLLAPKDGGELKAMLQWALGQPGPVAIRYPKANTTVAQNVVFDIEKNISSEILHQNGTCTILAVGNMVSVAENAAKILEQEIKCNVVNVRSLKPLDAVGLLPVLAGSNVVCTIEDNVLAGGFGSSILELLKDCPEKIIISFGYPDEFVPQAKIDELHCMYGLTPKAVAKKSYLVLE